MIIANNGFVPIYTIPYLIWLGFGWMLIHALIYGAYHAYCAVTRKQPVRRRLSGVVQWVWLAFAIASTVMFAISINNGNWQT